MRAQSIKRASGGTADFVGSRPFIERRMVSNAPFFWFGFLVGFGVIFCLLVY